MNRIFNKMFARMILGILGWSLILLFANTAKAVPQMVTPVPGSILTSENVIFTWDANGTTVTQWWLCIGSSQGDWDVFNSGPLGTNLSTTVKGLPVDSSQLFVRLWHFTSNSWNFTDYTYTAASMGAPEITSPIPGTLLTSSTETFTWTANGAPVAEWWLFVGSAQGQQDIFDSGSLGQSLSTTLSGLPTDGSQIHVRLWFRINDQWQFVDTSYLASFLQKGSIRYHGKEIVFIQQEANGFGPGAIVHFDIDSDGVFEQQVTTDTNNLFTISLDASGLEANDRISMVTTSADGSQVSQAMQIPTVQVSTTDLSSEIPVNLLPANSSAPEPGICSCTDCPPSAAMTGSSLAGFTHSYTPTSYGVELATGKLRQTFPILEFNTRVLNLDFHLHHASLVAYNGPYGQGISHSFNMMIVQTGNHTGRIVTPDLRIYEIGSEDGKTWFLPEGFYANLTLDSELHRWTLTHFSGLEVVFYQGALNHPGLPIVVREPNGNATSLHYDPSGYLTGFTTDLGQEISLDYNDRWQLERVNDHLERSWEFHYDHQARLASILTPETEYAHMAAGVEITDTDLPERVVANHRTTRLQYQDESVPNHISLIIDPRGAVPKQYVYDSQGRVAAAVINGSKVTLIYNPTSNPVPLFPLEEINRITRTIDREGNVTDTEMLGTGLMGQYGIRRQVTWTEKGLGREPLREDEPDYWEQRWLQTCDCLKPEVVVQSFSSADAEELEFDENGIPFNWPQDRYSYNANRQVLVHEYTNGIESIRSESTYQALSFGEDGQYSRILTKSDPRAFSNNTLYEGLDFVHHYGYDNRGNRIRHDAPRVTRGVNISQPITESWAYNAFGQMIMHIDPNGNIKQFTYYDGESSGGDINTKGEFGGYLATITVGASDSADPVTNLITTFHVNALGMPTKKIDPKGFGYDYTYNDLGEVIVEREPLVTLRTGDLVRYETRTIYDGAGNKVMTRRSNINFDGRILANEFIDQSTSYDAVNNLLSVRSEVDHNDANDITTRYAYDKNDDLIVVQKPEGNRTFTLYDERRLPYKEFYGVAPGSTMAADYPAVKTAEDLKGVDFIGLSIQFYDARRNPIRTRDGRGHFIDRFFDFYNRQVAEADQNGNGWRRIYDDAANVLTHEHGAVTKDTGEFTQILSRSYARFDEIGRRYQEVFDIDLKSNEHTDIDPDDGQNSSYLSSFDPGSRLISEFDANGNVTTFTYDSANRQSHVTDVLGNRITYVYDANSNIMMIEEVELPGPEAVGNAETYQTTYEFDELNRQIAEHIRGLDGASIDHTTLTDFDSRHNARLIQDAEGNFTLTTLDDLDREIVLQKFDHDPSGIMATELLHYECRYDKNSRKREDHVLSDVNDPNSAQVTHYAYDHLDRLIRTVYPDSDDPIDGSSNGADDMFDRVENLYDANSNVTHTIDQREVLFTNTFDPGNRLVDQTISLPSTVLGVTRQRYSYDALNRIFTAENNYAMIVQEYDSLSRLMGEMNLIQLDGQGFQQGWQEPVIVRHAYDKQSNRVHLAVVYEENTDLVVDYAHDALNRVGEVSAAYFDVPYHRVVDYRYVGPWRLQSKTLGNGARLTNSFDVKRRIKAHRWHGPSRPLVGFEYGYDRVDNALFERFIHDHDRYDHFDYNDRYELTGVAYRSPQATPPSTPDNEFQYDDVFNRIQADFSSPFDSEKRTRDAYRINAVNEYTTLDRQNMNANIRWFPSYDRTGNIQHFPVRPVTGIEEQSDVTGFARWDAFNCLFDLETEGVNPKQHYRYDPFRRRIATLSGSNEKPERRYIYDGWSVVEERVFDAGATPSSASSTLERIYVNGRHIDEPILAAIDRNQDGQLGGANIKNQRNIDADQEYYFLCNRLGSVMALLDADHPDRVLEYYRHTVFGETTVLPVIEDENGLEITPFDLFDNYESGPQRFSEEFGNVYLFTARRFDHQTGLYYYRNRYAETKIGRFLTRDPLELLNRIDPNGYSQEGIYFFEKTPLSTSYGLNFYAFMKNSPKRFIDPLGLKEYPHDFIGPLLPGDWRADPPGSKKPPFERPPFPPIDRNLAPEQRDNPGIDLKVPPLLPSYSGSGFSVDSVTFDSGERRCGLFRAIDKIRGFPGRIIPGAEFTGGTKPYSDPSERSAWGGIEIPFPQKSGSQSREKGWNPPKPPEKGRATKHAILERSKGD